MYAIKEGGGMAKRSGVIICGLGVFCLLIVMGIALAQETSNPSAAKGEIKSDIQQIKAQRDTIHENAQAAREEEKQLKQQIKEAVAAGDHKTAKKLRDQLHATHRENVAGMHQDIQSIQRAKQELRSDIKDARQQGQLFPKGVNPPGTGQVVKDKLENIRDRKEDLRDRREDIKDRRGDIRDKKEDVWDRRHDGGRADKLEDIRDRREDVRDRKEDVKDRREDIRDRREDVRDKGNIHDRGLHKGDDAGIRDRGKGVGAGKGQGVGKDHMGGGKRR
jgi:F0F1-type ATP synthase membrane subunit b/b'